MPNDYEPISPERVLEECTFMALRLGFDNSHDAEDAAAEGVIAMLEAQERAEEGKPVARFQRRYAFGAIRNFYNRNRKRRTRESVTLNNPVRYEQNNANDRTEFIDLLPEEKSESYQERRTATENDQHIRALVDSLPEQKAAVIRSRFFQRLLQGEIARELNLSKERVRQLEEEALDLLRHRYEQTA